MQREYIVSFSDTDTMGCMYHARYLDFFERERFHFLLQAFSGIHNMSLYLKDYMFAVRKVEIIFQKPLFLGDSFFVQTDVSDQTGARIFFKQSCLSMDSDIMATAFVEVVHLGKDFYPVRITPSLQKILASLVEKQKNIIC